MMNRRQISFLALGLTLCGAVAASGKPLKVFILAGQSNMQGHAKISTMDSMLDEPQTAPILKQMRTADGKPVVCDEVWISSIGCAGDLVEQKGNLTAGFGASPQEIGPEYTFGIYTQKMLGEPILIIKTSWGGKNIQCDFRPPDAGRCLLSRKSLDRIKERHEDPQKAQAKLDEETGVFYHRMVDHVRKVLADIKRVDPNYDPAQGYELAGFVWFQGFNDMIDSGFYPNRMTPGGYDQYSELLADLIRDLRKDLNAPKLPVVIGVMGIGGNAEGSKPPQLYFRQAQAAPASLPEFRGTVVAVQTAPFWSDDLAALQQRREKVESKLNKETKNLTRAAREAARNQALSSNFTPEELNRLKGISNGGYHYLGAARILAPIGKAFAEAVVHLQPAQR